MALKQSLPANYVTAQFILGQACIFVRKLFSAYVYPECPCCIWSCSDYLLQRTAHGVWL